MEFTAALEFRISSQHRLPTYEEWHVLSVWKPYRIFVMLEPIQEYFTEFILSFECLTPLWSLSAKGARSSALVYSISETAKLNNLRPYYYFRHILTG